MNCDLRLLSSSHFARQTQVPRYNIMTYLNSLPIKQKNKITVPQPQLSTKEVRSHAQARSQDFISGGQRFWRVGHHNELAISKA